MSFAPERRGLRVVDNPPSPYLATTIDWLGEPPEHQLEVYEDRSKSILSKNDSPDISFTWSANPYRGCYHGCAYCYARPTHQYLDFQAGTDFERKLVIKRDAPKLLREAFDKPSWKGELVVFSGVTDCYQPLEATYGLTRACLEICRDYKNPVFIITKSTLIERDIDLLRELPDVHVRVSVPFMDPDVARAMEPYVPKPSRRIEVIARLAEAGISVGVNLAPLIPGLGDVDAPAILEAAHRAGARTYGLAMLRLPGPVEEVFETRLKMLLPLRAERVLHQIEACRGGARYDPRFGARMQGTGPRWAAIQTMVEQAARRLGYDEHTEAGDEETASPFRRPGKNGDQLTLF